MTFIILFYFFDSHCVDALHHALPFISSSISLPLCHTHTPTRTHAYYNANTKPFIHNRKIFIHDRKLILLQVPILLLCNKQDVPGAMSVAEVKAVFNEVAPRLGVRDVKADACSAASDAGVVEAVAWLAAAVKRNPLRPPASDQVM